MFTILLVVQILVSISIITLVLLQQGKGADLSVFGGGSTQAAFGARGAATLLHKMTVAGFIGFIFTTMSIGFLQSSSRSSVMEAVEAAPTTGIEVEVPETQAPAPEATAPAAEGEGDASATGESGGEAPAATEPGGDASTAADSGGGAAAAAEPGGETPPAAEQPDGS